MSDPQTISFLSDYGTGDEFVGIVHSVIRQLAPDAAVIDITHGIRPHDLKAGGLTLARSVQYLAPGVVLGIVDPGVGTDRRAVAIEAADGDALLVGPDNGLLAGAVAMLGGATRAFQLTNPDYQLAAPGPTFAGRDVFAPAAAHLVNGVDPEALGPEIDPVTLVPAMIPITRMEEGRLVAEVLWTDRFGNLQLNVDPAEIDGWGERIEIGFDGRMRTGSRRHTYADIAPNEIGLVVDSYGLVSMAMDSTSAADDLGLGTGAEVQLRRFDDDEQASPTNPIGTRVELGRRP